MRFFKLLYDYNNDKDTICCESRELYNVNRYDVEQGKYISDWNNRITFEYNPEEGNRETDYLGNDLGWLIISHRAKKILEDNKIEGIQYLPICIKNKLTNIELTNFYVANICNLVDALDLQKSDYSVYQLDETKDIIAVKLHVLRKSEIRNKEIFRLETDKMPKFVSKKVVDLIKKNKLTGFDFNEVRVE